jgi:hypothetical protein
MSGFFAPSVGFVRRVVAWLRAGYPDTVHPLGYVGLLGILQRSLTPAELTTLAKELADVADTGPNVLTSALLRRRIQDVVMGPPLEADVVLLAAYLDSAGWPVDMAPQEACAPARGHRTWSPGARRQRWLRRLQPTGLSGPADRDIVTTSRRALSTAEVAEVGCALAKAQLSPPNRLDVGVAIAQITRELPLDLDIDRVGRYLNDHGWPVDFVI